MIFEVGKEMRYFLLVILGMIFGFAFAFHLLFAERTATTTAGDIHDNFSTVGRSVVSVVAMSVGSFDHLMFWESSVAPLAIVLFSLFLVLVLILLLNLLIALLSDVYTKIKQSETLHLLRERAMLIEEIEASMPESRRKALAERLPERLAAFRPPGTPGATLGEGAEEGWERRLEGIQMTLSRLGTRLKRLEAALGTRETISGSDSGTEWEREGGRGSGGRMHPQVARQLLMLYDLVREGAEGQGGGEGSGSRVERRRRRKERNTSEVIHRTPESSGLAAVSGA